MLTYCVYAPLFRSILPCTASLYRDFEQALSVLNFYCKSHESSRQKCLVGKTVQYTRVLSTGGWANERNPVAHFENNAGIPFVFLRVFEFRS